MQEGVVNEVEKDECGNLDKDMRRALSTQLKCCHIFASLCKSTGKLNRLERRSWRTNIHSHSLDQVDIEVTSARS